MRLRRKFIQNFCSITGIFLFFLSICAASFAQSPLPLLSSWQEKMEMFPCRDCHQDMPAESIREGAELEEHTHISLQHGGLRCLDCHNPEDRNLLRTIDRRLVGFSQMEEICGLCHAANYRDWQKGIHGKLVGSWKGIQQGLRCAECHNVHQPKPMILDPEKPPQPQPASPPWLTWP